LKEGQHSIAEKLLRTAFKTAEEAEFTSLILTASDELRYIYVQNGNVNAFRKISAELAKYREQLQYEQHADDLYYAAKLEMNRSVTARKS
ncbi:hypothetical protein NL358_27580, partial [Klebsiella pneumoniae]|nr:hypothetical protein [Klebsiella pneumoniae]